MVSLFTESMLKLFASPIDFAISSLAVLSSMAEGGIIEKFPDSWDLQYLWAIVVEHLAGNHPMDILIEKVSTSLLISNLIFQSSMIRDESLYIFLYINMNLEFFFYTISGSGL